MSRRRRQQIAAAIGVLLSGMVVAAGSLSPVPPYPSKQEDDLRPKTLRESVSSTLGPGQAPPRLVAARGSSRVAREAPVTRARSPRSAVRRLRRWVAMGVPTLPFLYEPTVARYLGARLILQSLAPLRNLPLGGKLRQDRVDGGVIVVANGRNPGNPPTIDRYLVIRKQGSWLIRYDSALTAQIGQLAQKSFRGNQSPDQGAPNQAAAEASENVKDAIVSRFIPRSLIDRLAAP